MFESVTCALSGRCSGCAWIGLPYADQIATKRDRLFELLSQAGVRAPNDVNVTSIAPAGLRDRVDFTIEERYGRARAIGLYSVDRAEILDLGECPALSPRLAEWFKDFRQFAPRVERGSVRLRVSPSGERGAWLDLANVDVKRLLDERAPLEDLLDQGAVVEIGQRRKRLVRREDGALKLADPVLLPWFETYLGEVEAPAPLYGYVGGFTQPGFAANRALVREAMRTFATARARATLEFGSGNGNFTLPLAATGTRVVACEIDAPACEALARSAAENGLTERIELQRGDFHAKAQASFEDVDCVFADPPRSGLKRFLDPLERTARERRPRGFVYVSCFPESFADDSARLQAFGYELARLTIVDQFPQSPHFETVAAFELLG